MKLIQSIELHLNLEGSKGEKQTTDSLIRWAGEGTRKGMPAVFFSEPSLNHYLSKLLQKPPLHCWVVFVTCGTKDEDAFSYFLH